jgi:hypothetical protein
MRFSKAAIGLAAAMIAVAAGCAKRGRPGQFDGEGATFERQKISATQVVPVQDSDSDLERRQTLITFQVCVQDAALQRPIIGQGFELQGGPAPQSFVTDAQGCGRWTERFEYAPAETSAYLRYDRELVGQPPQSGSLTLSLAINPWLRDPSAVVDLLYDPYPGHEGQALSGDGRSRVVVTALTRQFLGHDFARYSVTPDLQLTVAHRFRVQLSPRVLARDSHGGLEESSIRGRYRLLTVLASGHDGDPLTADSVIAADTCYAQLNGGDLVCDLTYAYPQLVLSVWRQRLFVELAPVNADNQPLPGFAPSAFAGYVIPAQGGEVKLLPTDEDVRAAARATTVRALPLSAPRPALERLRRGGYVRYAELEQFPAQPKEAITPSRATLARFMHDGRTGRGQVLNYMCGLAYSRKQPSHPGLLSRLNPPKDGSRLEGESDFDWCRRQPEAVLRFSLQDYVETLRSPRPLSPQSNMYASLSFSANVSRSLDEASTDAWGWNIYGDAHVSAGANHFPNGERSPFNLGAAASLGGGLSRAYTRSRSLTAGRSSGISSTRNLMVEHRSFEIDADVRRCVLFDARYGAMFKPIQICDAGVEARRFRENYYFIAQTWNYGDSPYVDVQEAGTALRFFIRGERRMEDFLRMAGNPQLEIVVGQEIAPVRELIGANGGVLLKASADQALPGVYDAYMSSWQPPGQDCKGARWLPDFLQLGCKAEMPQ